MEAPHAAQPNQFGPGKMDNSAAGFATPTSIKQDSDGATSKSKPVSSLLAATGGPVEGATNEQRPLTSQPMTASTSTSSLLSIKDPEIAAPYGTRSTRNRAGASRPNYAEDREMEMDFEYHVKEPEVKKKPQQSDTNTQSDQSLPYGRNAGVEGVFNGITSMSREHIPGTSTFSANPSPSGPPPSKKRKAAPAIALAASAPVAPYGSPYGGQTTTRGAYVAAQASSSIQDSNMLSFDRCGARLKDGKLIADDGTCLEVNGMHLWTFPIAIDYVLTFYIRPCIPDLRTAWRAVLPWTDNGVSSHQ